MADLETMSLSLNSKWRLSRRFAPQNGVFTAVLYLQNGDHSAILRPKMAAKPPF